jgi:protein-S-isoprenylcysteine O-methyltransferase Ste14
MNENVLLISSLFLWGFIHSILASLQIKAFIKNRFGQMVIRYYRLAYNIFAVISFSPIIGLMFILQDSKLYSIPMPWVTFPILVQLLSFYVLVIGLKQTGALGFLGLNVIIGISESEPQKLNNSGFYKYVRHPLYSAGILLLWFSPVMTTNSLIIPICMTIYIVIGALFEERKLVFEYGDIYREYRKQVPMLIPFLKWNKKK